MNNNPDSHKICICGNENCEGYYDFEPKIFSMINKVKADVLKDKPNAKFIVTYEYNEDGSFVTRKKLHIINNKEGK